MSMSPKRRFFLFVMPFAIGGLLAGLGVNAAVAGPSVEGSPSLEPGYSRNADGLTYGSAFDATSPDTEPDLVLVVTTDGREGYAKKADLAEAEGSGFSSPAEAIAWQEAHDSDAGTPVVVYKSDGRTAIGTFLVGGK